MNNNPIHQTLSLFLFQFLFQLFLFLFFFSLKQCASVWEPSQLTSPFSLSFLESLGDRSEAIAAIADTTSSSSMVGGVGVGVGVGPVVAMVDEGGLGKRFWIKVRNDTAAVLYSPFFVSLASGHLLPETFRHCISQDVHFLRAYAQAWVQNRNVFALSLSRSLYM